MICFQLLGDRALHGHATGDRELEARPVDLGQSRRVEQRVVQRVDADDRGEARLLEHLMNAGRSRGLVISTFCAPIFDEDVRLPVSAKTWYSGSGMTTVSSPSCRSRAIQAATCCRLATMLPWVSIAPLATPVVPPVYCRKAMSSWVSGTSSSDCAGRRQRRVESGRARPMRQRGTIFFTCLTTMLVSAA